MNKLAEDIVQKHGWKIIDISLQAENVRNGYKIFCKTGVEEFLSLVKYVEFGITNSFHGAIFSISIQSDKVEVRHKKAEGNAWSEFCKSKYSQSIIGHSFRQVKKNLIMGKTVLFSGTPCQNNGLKNFLGREYVNLLTVEIICGGVPSPLLIQKLIKDIEKQYCSKVDKIDYRYKSKTCNKWDFEQMYISFQNGKFWKKTVGLILFGHYGCSI